MATCAHCKTEETQLFDSEVLACAKIQEAKSKQTNWERRITANGSGNQQPEIVPEDLKRRG